MEENIKEWLLEADFSSYVNYKVLEIVLFREFVYWCSLRGYEVSDVTVKGLSDCLANMGFQRIRKHDGMAYIMRRGDVR